MVQADNAHTPLSMCYTTLVYAYAHSSVIKCCESVNLNNYYWSDCIPNQSAVKMKVITQGKCFLRWTASKCIQKQLTAAAMLLSPMSIHQLLSSTIHNVLHTPERGNYQPDFMYLRSLEICDCNGVINWCELIYVMFVRPDSWWNVSQVLQQIINLDDQNPYVDRFIWVLILSMIETRTWWCGCPS